MSLAFDLKKENDEARRNRTKFKQEKADYRFGMSGLVEFPSFPRLPAVSYDCAFEGRKSINCAFAAGRLTLFNSSIFVIAFPKIAGRGKLSLRGDQDPVSGSTGMFSLTLEAKMPPSPPLFTPPDDGPGRRLSHEGGEGSHGFGHVRFTCSSRGCSNGGTMRDVDSLVPLLPLSNHTSNKTLTLYVMSGEHNPAELPYNNGVFETITVDPQAGFTCVGDAIVSDQPLSLAWGSWSGTALSGSCNCRYKGWISAGREGVSYCPTENTLVGKVAAALGASEKLNGKDIYLFREDPNDRITSFSQLSDGDSLTACFCGGDQVEQSCPCLNRICSAPVAKRNALGGFKALLCDYCCNGEACPYFEADGVTPLPKGGTSQYDHPACYHDNIKVNGRKRECTSVTCGNPNAIRGEDVGRYEAFVGSFSEPALRLTNLKASLHLDAPIQEMEVEVEPTVSARVSGDLLLGGNNRTLTRRILPAPPDAVRPAFLSPLRSSNPCSV